MNFEIISSFINTKKILIIFYVIISTFVNIKSYPQQFIVDNAEITDYNAFQVEAWYGKSSKWLLPAFHYFKNLEFTCGIGLEKKLNKEENNILIQGKTIFNSNDSASAVIGFVGGTILSFNNEEKIFTSFYVYTPISICIWHDKMIIHQNFGYLASTDCNGLKGLFLWGSRFEILPIEKFTFWIEVFVEGFSKPEFQIAIQLSIIESRFFSTLSYAGNFSKDDDKGLFLGISVTPPPIF
ncbi:MAG: hypothetical protein N2490_07145 [Ignavibacteria bacterium]|nr:hypothetical protein [Ignavibacteria bacterium]